MSMPCFFTFERTRNVICLRPGRNGILETPHVVSYGVEWVFEQTVKNATNKRVGQTPSGSATLKMQYLAGVAPILSFEP